MLGVHVYMDVRRTFMVRASQRPSEGCGFDPRLRLRNNFSEDNMSLTNVLRTSKFPYS